MGIEGFFNIISIVQHLGISVWSKSQIAAFILQTEWSPSLCRDNPVVPNKLKCSRRDAGGMEPRGERWEGVGGESVIPRTAADKYTIRQTMPDT